MNISNAMLRAFIFILGNMGYKTCIKIFVLFGKVFHLIIHIIIHIPSLFLHVTLYIFLKFNESLWYSSLSLRENKCHLKLLILIQKG